MSGLGFSLGFRVEAIKASHPASGSSSCGSVLQPWIWMRSPKPLVRHEDDEKTRLPLMEKTLSQQCVVSLDRAQMVRNPKLDPILSD